MIQNCDEKILTETFRTFNAASIYEKTQHLLNATWAKLTATKFMKVATLKDGYLGTTPEPFFSLKGSYRGELRVALARTNYDLTKFICDYQFVQFVDSNETTLFIQRFEPETTTTAADLVTELEKQIYVLRNENTAILNQERPSLDPVTGESKKKEAIVKEIKAYIQRMKVAKGEKFIMYAPSLLSDIKYIVANSDKTLMEQFRAAALNGITEVKQWIIDQNLLPEAQTMPEELEELLDTFTDHSVEITNKTVRDVKSQASAM